MILKSRRKAISAILTVLFLVVGIIPLFNKVESASAAMDVSRFNPGLIISDAAFYDSSNMSIAQIQRFLEEKVPNCTAREGEPTCLKNYKTNSPAVTGEPGICESMPDRGEVTAAELIYYVGKACGVSPRVILVMLQKEQGLVLASRPYYSASNPTRRYTFALGMDCPDTPAGCAKSSAGFFWQLYKGIGQLNRYITYPTKYPNYQPGSRKIFYHPNDSCGRATVNIQNKATTALYTYTPYVPNAAALRDLQEGTGNGALGDGCSAYGNRNFWRWYSVWFGDPIAGSFILTSAEGKKYLIVNNQRALFEDDALLAAYKSLGPVGKVSQTYLDSFEDTGKVSRLVTRAGNVFFVDGGKKYSFSNCDQAKVFALECADALALSSAQSTFLPTGGAITEYVPGENGDTYIIQDGTKRQILDVQSLTDSRIGVPALSAVKISALSHLPWGKPIVKAGLSFTNSTTKGLVVFDGENSYNVDAKVAAALAITKWFPKSEGKLSSESIAPIDGGVALKEIVQNAAGVQYLLTKAGKRKVSGEGELAAGAPVVSDSLLALIPNASTEIASSVLVRASGKSEIYLIENGKKRQLLNAASAAKFVPVVANDHAETLTVTALAQIPLGAPAITPGAYVQVSGGATKYLIDGLSRALIVPDANQAALLGLSNPSVVSKAQFKGYTKSSKLSGLKFFCDGKYYISVTGKYYAISEADASHYPGRGLILDKLTCQQLAKPAAKLGRFVKDANKNFWLIEAGTKRAISNAAAYSALRGDQPKAVSVGPYFLSKFTTGKKAGDSMNTDAVPVAGPVTPKSGVDGPSPTPTPTASPSASATPSSSPSPSVAAKPSTYTVKPGDTWSKIVNYLFTNWKVTEAKLSAANPKITNKDLIKVGQVLVVP